MLDLTHSIAHEYTMLIVKEEANIPNFSVREFFFIFKFSIIENAVHYRSLFG